MAIDWARLNGDLINRTYTALRGGQGSIQSAKENIKILMEPNEETGKYPWQFFKLVDSSGVIIEDATQDPPRTFREFIEAPPLRGLGERLEDVERLISDDARAQVKLRELVVAPKHLHQGKDDSNNVTINSDLLTEPEPATRTAERGNSRAYTLSRLDRERPDLFELVVQGEMSANAAAIMAGWRKQATALETLQRTWKKASEDEQRLFLEWLANEQ